MFVQSKSADASDELQLSPVHINQQLTETNVSSSIPDLLDPRISVDSSVELHLPESAADRLTMLGGVSGMLTRMDRDRAKPDVKTFSLLLDVMPLSSEAETDLLSAMDFYDVQADVDFYNMLIRKRNLRRDFAGAYVGYTAFSDVLATLHLYCHMLKRFFICINVISTLCVFSQVLVTFFLMKVMDILFCVELRK